MERVLLAIAIGFLGASVLGVRLAMASWGKSDDFQGMLWGAVAIAAALTSARLFHRGSGDV